MAANSIILVTKPDHEDDVEGSGGVLEELGHDGLHAHQGEYDRQERGSRERDVGVELQHLKEVHDEDEDLVLGVSEQHGDGHGLNETLINFMRKISKPCQLSLIS